jgi:hypothetical protein
MIGAAPSHGADLFGCSGVEIVMKRAGPRLLPTYSKSKALTVQTGAESSLPPILKGLDIGTRLREIRFRQPGQAVDLFLSRGGVLRWT